MLTLIFRFSNELTVLWLTTVALQLFGSVHAVVVVELKKNQLIIANRKILNKLFQS